MRKNAPLRQHATEFVHLHPRVTWATLSSTVVILSALGGWAYWLATHYVTAPDAASAETKLRADFKVELDKLRGEITEAQRRASTRSTWLMYGQAQTNLLIVRNRVNECDAKVDDGKLTAGERGPCAQYRREYDEQKQRTDDLYKQAMQLGRND